MNSIRASAHTGVSYTKIHCSKDVSLKQLYYICIMVVFIAVTKTGLSNSLLILCPLCGLNLGLSLSPLQRLPLGTPQE